MLKKNININSQVHIRDWSKSTGEGGGPEHFQMWWLENT